MAPARPTIPGPTWMSSAISKVPTSGSFGISAMPTEPSSARSRTVSGRYRVPHLTHAAMEPLVATAHPKADGTLELWAPVQYADMARDVAAEAAGIEPDMVRCHQTLLGGAFGRKAQMDFVVEAVKLSEMLGKPVRVQWTREDDVRHGYYHALSVQKLDAALDEENRVTGWRHRLATNSIVSTFAPGIRFLGDDFLNQGIIDMPFAIPNIRVENVATETLVRIGWCRSVYNINSAFSIGSFLDELAIARGMDPIDNFLDLLGPDRNFDYPGVILEGEGSSELRRIGRGLPVRDRAAEAGRRAGPRGVRMGRRSIRGPGPWLRRTPHLPDLRRVRGRGRGRREGQRHRSAGRLRRRLRDRGQPGPGQGAVRRRGDLRREPRAVRADHVLGRQDRAEQFPRLPGGEDGCRAAGSLRSPHR